MGGVCTSIYSIRKRKLEKRGFIIGRGRGRRSVSTSFLQVVTEDLGSWIGVSFGWKSTIGFKSLAPPHEIPRKLEGHRSPRRDLINSFVSWLKPVESFDERHSRSSQPENELSTALVSLERRERERKEEEKIEKKGEKRERPGSRERKKRKGKKKERKKEKNVAIFLYRKSFDRDVLEWASWASRGRIIERTGSIMWKWPGLKVLVVNSTWKSRVDALCISIIRLAGHCNAPVAFLPLEPSRQFASRNLAPRQITARPRFSQFSPRPCFCNILYLI